MKHKTLTYWDRMISFFDKNAWYIFFILLLLGMYLRFFRIEEVLTFGWDQTRDAWAVRDILNGQFTLIGPRTGIGHFHLGPAHFYLLAPFFWFTKLDPMASNYFNILLNIINFFIIFIVTKKLFNNHAALFVTFVYSVSSYLIQINRVPWNVTLMPGIALLMFFATYKIYKQEYKWMFLLVTLAGAFFHIHFTAIFMPAIILFSLVFVKHKLVVLKYMFFSLPLYLIWFIPNIVHEMQSVNTDYSRYQNFIKDYYIGFHLRFMLHRVSDGFIQFQTILFFPFLKKWNLVFPFLYALLILFYEKNSKARIIAYVIGVWFFIPLVGFTLYGGPISEYYLLSSVPFVLYILYSIQRCLLQVPYKWVIFFILVVFWSFYAYENTKGYWIKPTYGGLSDQKKDIREIILRHDKVKFNLEDIGSYLYEIWKDKPRKDIYYNRL